jgi:ferredoxin
MSEASAVHLVEVDQVKCCGYGMCAELAPDVFALDEAGFVVAKRTEIPHELMAATEDAVYSCPEGVLKLSKKIGLD